LIDLLFRLKAAMIKIDFADLSIEALENFVKNRCSAYGSVERVPISRNGTAYAIAAVAMRTKTELQAVSQGLGELLVDDNVLIRIVQK
jgi:hypothetical protein